ncbi:MAG: hypothetical protein ACI8QC_004309 [Planctomycetota bacterium]|jgi:hypothetical protein
MNFPIRLALPLLLVVTLCSGCSITNTVSPLAAPADLQELYLQRNDKVHMAEFHGALSTLLRDQGIKVHTVEGEFEPEMVHQATYTANWQWDVTMYLSYFQLLINENGALAGSAEYDARSGSANLGKFGKAVSKIEPLIFELFGRVQEKPERSHEDDEY